MTFNVMDVAETIVNHIKTNCPDDVAIIAYYGSYSQGTATKRSDLDFFFIPATPKGYNASIQFIINDISFDFWPIGWERAERMATFQELNTSIIADCKLLYYRTDDALNRFNKLKETIVNMPKHGLKLMEKSESKLRDAYVHLYKMSRGSDPENITFYRHEAQSVLINVLESLSLLNRTYYSKGWGKNWDQINQFDLKPSHLDQQIETIMYSSSCEQIREACEQLTNDTLKLLIDEKYTFSAGPAYSDRMNGFYEETKGILDKLKTACETNDYKSAYIWSIGVQDEIARFIYYAEKGHWPVDLNPSLDYQQYYNDIGFPNLIAYLDPQNLTPLLAAVEQLNSQLENYLITQGVKIKRFQTLEQFNQFLNTRLEK